MRSSFLIILADFIDPELWIKAPRFHSSHLNLTMFI
jgi:hypothetical protein